MAESVIKYQKPISYVHSTLSIAGDTYAVNTGRAYSVPVTVPDGYKILAHVTCWTTGQSMLVGSMNVFTTSSPASVFVANGATIQITNVADALIHVLTLIQPI